MVHFIFTWLLVLAPNADIVIAIDVSDSTIQANIPAGFENKSISRRKAMIDYPPSDPEGYRWDGTQFLIDVAGPDDRIAIILYKADAVVATAKIPGHEGGFVAVKTHRILLKEMVRKFRAAERDFANEVKRLSDILPDDDFIILPDENSRNQLVSKLKGITYEVPLDSPIKLPVIRYGTSTLNAVRQAARLLSPQRESNSEVRIFLFTDGIETTATYLNGDSDVDDISDDRLKPGKIFFRALSQRKAGKDSDQFVESMLADDLPRLRRKESPLPLFCFTFGPYIDSTLMGSLVKSVSPRGRQAGAYYHCKTNRELLDRLQEVGWETREMWTLKRESESDKILTEFELPFSPIWSEAAALAYATRNNRAGHPQALQLQPKGDTSQLLECDSHGFAWLAMPSPAQGYTISAEKQPSDSGLTCIWGLRTSKPLFSYLGPLAEYELTPLDAIPLRVLFQPADAQTKAVDFKVFATLTRLESALLDSDSTIRIPLEPRQENGQTVFAADFVLDGNRTPFAPGRPELMGDWLVEVEIEGVAGLLLGARRKLLRRDFKVGNYPSLRAPERGDLPRVLLNKDDCELGIHLDLPLRYPPANLGKLVGIVTDIKSVVPWVADESPVAGIQSWNKSTGRIGISLPGRGWRKLKVGQVVDGVRLEARAPWDTDAKKVSVPFSIRREPFALVCVEQTEGLRVAVNGRRGEPISATTRVYLDTPIDATEPVNLGAGPVSVEMAPAVGSGSGFKVNIELAGLEPLALGRGGMETNIESVLGLRLSIPEEAPHGRFKGMITFTGPGVTSVRVPIFVERDQPKVYTQTVADAHWETASRIDVYGQAGTIAQCRIKLESSLNKTPLPSSIQAINELKGKEGRALPVVLGGNGTAKDHLVSFPVEKSIFPGRYERPLVLAYENDNDKGKVVVPIYAQVARHALEAVPAKGLDGPEVVDGWFRLRLPQEGKKILKAQFALEPKLGQGGVEARWFVTSKPVTEGLGAWKGISADKIRFKVREIIKDGKPGADVLSESEDKDKQKSTTSILKNPLELSVEADATDLPPGLYRTKLLFHSKLDGSTFGQPHELPIEFLAAGETIEARWVDARATGQINQPAELRVTVLAYGKLPGKGSIRLPRSDGSSDENVPVTMGKTGISDPTYPTPNDLIRFERLVEVKPKLIGENKYVLEWDNNQSSPILPLWKAIGKPEIIPAISEDGKDIIVRVPLAPGPQRSTQIEMECVNPKKAGSSKYFTLSDSGLIEDGDEKKGDGVYSGKVKFDIDEFGSHVIRTKSKEPKELTEAIAIVGYNLLKKHARGEFNKDPGIFYGENDWKNSNLLTFTNKRDRACKYNVRVRYLANQATAGQVDTDLDTLDEKNNDYFRSFDKDKDFQVDPVVNGSDSNFSTEEGFERVIVGKLDPDETIDFGLKFGLTDEAKNNLDHPTMMGDYYSSVIEITVEWDGDDGIKLVKRSLATVRTVPTPIEFWFVMIVVLCIGVWFTNRWRQGKWPFRKRAKAIKTGKSNAQAGNFRPRHA
jgi:hypothetical protein